MPILLQINAVLDSTATGKITDLLGQYVGSNGWRSVVSYGRRTARPSASELLSIVNGPRTLWHVAATRLLDRHGLHSIKPTRRLISAIRALKPDLIHIHNLHGYYICYPLLYPCRMDSARLLGFYWSLRLLRSLGL